MDGFNTDGFNHSSHYFGQQAHYPWVIDNTDPTFTNDDSTTIHLNSNAYEDIASNVSNNPYNASLGVLPGQGFYSDGAIDLFDQSTGTDQVLLLPTDLHPHLVDYICIGCYNSILDECTNCAYCNSAFHNRRKPSFVLKLGLLILTDFKFHLLPSILETSISHLTILKTLI